MTENVDIVNKPPHYTQLDGIDCMDVIEDLGLDKHFHLACAFKYIWRFNSKGDLKNNLKKSVWYINRYINFIGTNGIKFTETSGVREQINNPDHYNKSKYECIDLIEKLGLYKDHHVANAFKYIYRWDAKDNPVENLKKAVWYLNRKIELLEKEND
jgi:hypothetical protein